MISGSKAKKSKAKYAFVAALSAGLLGSIAWTAPAKAQWDGVEVGAPAGVYHHSLSGERWVGFGRGGWSDGDLAEAEGDWHGPWRHRWGAVPAPAPVFEDDQIVERHPAVVERTVVVRRPVVQRTVVIQQPIVKRTVIVERPVVKRTVVVERPVVTRTTVIERPVIQRRVYVQ